MSHWLNSSNSNSIALSQTFSSLTKGEFGGAKGNGKRIGRVILLKTDTHYTSVTFFHWGIGKKGSLLKLDEFGDFLNLG